MSTTFPGGWPSTITRDDLGPVRQDDGTITEHEKARAADCDNLADWQLAGANLCVFRWWAVLQWDGTALNVVAAEEAWDPNQQSTPSATRTAAGRYRLSYESSYPNRTGNLTPTALVAVGAVIPQDKVNNYDVRAEVSANQRDVEIQIDVAAVGADVKIFVGGM